MFAFQNIWIKYKLPQVKTAEMYDNWITNQMQFWQNQLNFAVWCATTGCGVSKLDHLRNKRSYDQKCVSISYLLSN